MSEKLLTQDEVNEIIKDRLAREKRKHREEVEQLKARIAELEGGALETETEADEEELEEPEQGEVEEPEEEGEESTPEEEGEEEQAEYKAKYIEVIKQIKLLDAGFTFEQLERYAPYITGENEEEIERQSLELAEEVESKRTRTYADPSSRRRVGVYNPFE